ncbi:MAG: Si-specific NAD(P)(+) transhydrogenase [Planctomycetota bacterium]
MDDASKNGHVSEHTRHRYDLAVIGSGPAGQKAAIQAAKLGKRVCVVERRDVVGGVAINTGTIPSKALREAVLHLTGHMARTHLGDRYEGPAKRVNVEDLIYWCQQVIKAEISVIRSQMVRNDVDVFTGTGRFLDANTIRIEHGSEALTLHADHFLVATGTAPARPGNIPFDDRFVVDADAVLQLSKLPRTLTVVGGGVIGTEYASMMQALGVKVTLVEGRDKLLEFLDPEVTEALQYHLRQAGMTLRLGEKVTNVEVIDAPDGVRTPEGKLVIATLESGKTIKSECLLYCIGRQGQTDALNLQSVGLEADRRGRLTVNDDFQTDVSHIYAAGDVIGFPALASTSMEQGRIAASHMFESRINRGYDRLFPFGIYAIPEISMVGWTEQALTEQDIPYESGVANYREIARGQLLGDDTGMLKLLIHQETRHVLGAHAIGTGATELIHIAQAVMAHNGTVDYFVDTVFNYPTLAECYKVAALNGVNKLAHLV